MRLSSRALGAIVAFWSFGVIVGPATVAIANSEEPFAGVTEQVPEFAGAYVNEGRRELTILLTDVRDEVLARAREAVLRVLSDEYRSYQVVAVEARYSFQQLSEWHGAIRNVLSLQGVVFTDADEVRNRIVVGVEDPAQHGSSVAREAARAGIPRDALLIEKSGPVQQLSDDLGSQGGPAGARIATVLGVLAVTAGAVGLINYRLTARRPRAAEDIPTTRSDAGRPSLSSEPSGVQDHRSVGG